MKKLKFNTIESIISDARKGKMYILVDDENRENEGDLVFSAKDVTSEKINFMAKYGRGLICLAIDTAQAKKLNLNYMSPKTSQEIKLLLQFLLKLKKVFPLVYLQRTEQLRSKLQLKTMYLKRI